MDKKEQKEHKPSVNFKSQAVNPYWDNGKPKLAVMDNNKEECKNCTFKPGGVCSVDIKGDCIKCGRKINLWKTEEASQSPVSDEDICPHGAIDNECPVINCANYGTSNEKWESQFDSIFSEVFKNIKVTPRQSEEYDTAMILQKYYQDTGERIKDFIRKLLSDNKE